MLIPFLILMGACGPDHNPTDLQQIDALEQDGSKIQGDLDKCRSDLEIEVADHREFDKVVRENWALADIAQAYLVATKVQGSPDETRQLTICHQAESTTSPRKPAWVTLDTPLGSDCADPVSFSVEFDRDGKPEFDPNGD